MNYMIKIWIEILCIDSPQRAQRAGGIVRVWQIFGHGYDFPTWSELGTKSRVKVTYFGGKKYLEEFKKYL